jgi:hypothetical protein
MLKDVKIAKMLWITIECDRGLASIENSSNHTPKYISRKMPKEISSLFNQALGWKQMRR